jgi:hypothetical protein
MLLTCRGPVVAGQQRLASGGPFLALHFMCAVNAVCEAELLLNLSVAAAYAPAGFLGALLPHKAGRTPGWTCKVRPTQIWAIRKGFSIAAGERNFFYSTAEGLAA